VQGYVSAIRSSGKTLLRLINDILDLSKIEAGKLELEYRPFNPYALLEEIRQVFMWVITEKGLTLEEEVETDLPKEIMLDEIRLRQVLLNLVGNAVKFTSRGGICIRVRHERSADEAGKVDVIIVIEDSGSGIPADQLDMIFNAFQQSEQERKLKSGGSGLGLAISKRLVEMMGGEISVTSEKGKGSAFKVVLKGVEVGEGDGLMMAGSKAQEIQFEPGRVLVVDDVSYNRLLFRHYLRDVGLEIEEAEGGREALNKLKSMDEIPALILLDIKMPEIDGYAVMKRVKRDKRFKDVPIVVFTASATPEEERQVYLAGGDGFLKKPVSREALLDELGRHLPHQLHDVAPSASPVGMYRETANWEDTLRNVKNTESWSSFVEQVSGPGREQWERVSKTYIMDDVAALAEWAEDLAGRLGVSLLADWAVVLKKQANVFDVAAVVQTLACYGTLMEVVRKLTEEET
jgi:two-component system sensor histidine kinase EvgS